MIPLPVRSIVELPQLTWREVDYGYARNFLGWRTPIDLAIASIGRGSSNPLELELAATGKDQDWKVGQLVQELAAMEPSEPISDVKAKWLFIALDWLYQNKGSFANPLREVEEIYADFDYPQEIKDFVRFLPPEGRYQPLLQTREENVSRLFELWLQYLKVGRVAHPPRS